MAEWFKAAVLKTVGGKPPVGSNPTISANNIKSEAMKIEDIAKASHEIIRAMNKEIDGKEMPAWDDAEEWMRESRVLTVETILRNPTTPYRYYHDLWVKERTEAGWKWGEVRNDDTKENPGLVPYDELPLHLRAKDGVLRALVNSLAHLLQ